MIRWHLGRLRRSATLRWLILVLVIGGGADAVSRQLRRPVELVAVVVARRDVAAGERIGADALRVVRVAPGGLVPKVRLTSASDAEGRVALEPLFAGEPLRPERLSGSDQRGPAALLRSGERGVAVPLAPESAVPVGAGDTVSVFAASGPLRDDSAVAVVEAARVLVRHERAVTLAVPAAEVPGLAAALARGPVTIALRLPPTSVRTPPSPSA